MSAIIMLKHCHIKSKPFGCTTYFPDGAETSNWPHNDAEYERLSLSLGHTSVLDYCREHDLVHALLAERMFGAVSPVLWASAHGGDVTKEQGDWEERLVYYFQRFMHGRSRSPDPDWVTWKQEAQGCMQRLSA